MSENIEYEEVPVPDDTHPHDYTYVERRAEIYQLMAEAGHPKNLKQTRLSERYDTAVSNINKDFNILKDYRKERAGSRVISTTEFVVEKSVRELMDRGDFAKAVDKQLDYADWLFEEGIREREPEKYEHSGEVDVRTDADAMVEAMREARGSGSESERDVDE